ncbi:MAG: DUF1848 domain-containing protein [Symploca sp. SIO3C6]|uniref:DUF1848 domain-containing protein n=1 Tax=Symploca sp. SIO1C4 TaxID=2607765 RepID=A0A6B3NGJ0_9CYAN|nr:DUF1848 domain-containing protein [Symploca sp. SIO3C6]NER29134.1 DUF1848 domain-containing protein [Symploca sp. SIO1C4]NET07557.1 DUF1848 domain-containing protein [Symploca sp. SIO2B6]
MHVDFYGKTERNLRKVTQKYGVKFEHPSFEQKRRLVQQLCDIAATKGITLYSCCDDTLISDGVKLLQIMDHEL